ncbi:MAG: phosphomannomutase/phosphoglucomutase, partial [Lentimicrobium sp.]|nr:phosphomannomutase/phosphoglucomutase [Lentimicrobium sp.]
VGRAFAALKLREIDGLFGGELAGHYYFRDFYYSDSAYVAALIILGEVKKHLTRGITLSQLISSISNYYGTGEINFHIDKKAEAMEALKQTFCEEENPAAFFDFDGYRIEFGEWWFNVRPSNTEPYLRFLAEAKTPALLAQKKTAALEILRPFIVEEKHGH